MTNKEFDAKKQEIIDEVDALNDLGLINNEARAIIINPLNKLQPPKPPTCSTCEHFTGRRCDLGVTDRWLEADESFGCLHHSDYEVAKC